jgi:hypothetical protein
MEVIMEAFQDRSADKAKERDRRNQLGRAKAKAYRNSKVFFSFPCGWGGNSWEGVEKARAQYVRCHYRNRKRCSCHTCGNYRHNFKTKYALTRQELQADLRFEDMIEDL